MWTKKRFLRTESTISRCSWKIICRHGGNQSCDDAAASVTPAQNMNAFMHYQLRFVVLSISSSLVSGRDYITIPKTWVMSMYTPLTTSLGTTAQSVAIRCSLQFTFTQNPSLQIRITCKIRFLIFLKLIFHPLSAWKSYVQLHITVCCTVMSCT